MEPTEMNLIREAHLAVRHLFDRDLNVLEIAHEDGLSLMRRGYDATAMGMGPLTQLIFVLRLYRSALAAAGSPAEPEYAIRIPGPFTWVVRQLAFDRTHVPALEAGWSSRLTGDLARSVDDATTLCDRLVQRFGSDLQPSARTALSDLRPPPARD